MSDAIARLERELAAARHDVEIATRTRSAFLAAMSHEIKTPMNAVLGSSRLLLDTTLTALQREHVATTLAAGESLLTIVDDALDYAALEGGALTLAHVPFDVVDVIDAAIRLDAARADEKGLDLAALVDPAVPAQVVGDAARVRLIVRKLLANAITFTERGSVLIRVGVAAAGGLRIVDRGHWRRRRRRRRGAAVRGVRPGRHVDDAPPRRQRPGPGDLPPAGRSDGRPGGRRRRASATARGSGSSCRW